MNRLEIFTVGLKSVMFFTVWSSMIGTLRQMAIMANGISGFLGVLAQLCLVFGIIGIFIVLFLFSDYIGRFLFKGYNSTFIERKKSEAVFVMLLKLQGVYCIIESIEKFVYYTAHINQYKPIMWPITAMAVSVVAIFFGIYLIRDGQYIIELAYGEDKVRTSK